MTDADVERHLVDLKYLIVFAVVVEAAVDLGRGSVDAGLRGLLAGGAVVLLAVVVYLIVVQPDRAVDATGE
ncbi:hypothetical protein [Halobaculum limi]|uniref:hypothetical protein n=1 Tax=Halobaculum limi TaxID=3031916 RepID=UPI002406D362|nr:hypothetical protein [Halobaculum sp. YSMS11]